MAYDPAESRGDVTAHGSHMRRVKRRSGAPRPRTAPPVVWTRSMIVWRAALATVVIGAFAALVAGNAASVASGNGVSAAAIALLAFGTVATTYFAMTVYHALRYRAVPVYDDALLPRVTVIVPAYNEGAAVRVALESALASDYPKDKLQILAVDDGSKDDTWHHMEAVAQAHPDQILAFQQPENRGKREALREGFLQADGELVVTVDSDSKLEPGAIRAIVAPMIADPEVAAVAGRVLVLNRVENLFTRLLSARFFITFDLARAAQSRFGAVLCTPGALSAYRLDAVRKVLDRWSSQTFFGQPCTIAEDRALTTWLLREGYRSVYQRTAVVETLMPTDIKRIARMLIRWERGNIREDLVMLPHLFTRWRTRDQWWPTLEIVLELVQHPMGWLGLFCMAQWVVDFPSVMLLAGLVLTSALVQTLYTLRSERGSDFFYGVGYALLAFVGLQWVFPYSLVTVRDGRWLTR
jgi:hyaluronan synthase